jgi:hypothetical protein
MKTVDPPKACKDFIRLLRNQKIQTKDWKGIGKKVTWIQVGYNEP